MIWHALRPGWTVSLTSLPQRQQMFSHDSGWDKNFSSLGAARLDMGICHNKPFTFIGNPTPQAVNFKQEFSPCGRFTV